MRFRWLFVFPLAWGVAFLVLGAVFSGAESHSVFLRSEIEMAKALALLGAMGAALAHQPGEHLRRAWMLVGVGYGLFLFRDLRSVPAISAAIPGSVIEPVSAVLVIGGNVSIFLGIYMLARTWKMAGLALPGTRRDRVMVAVVVTVVSMVLVGPGIIRTGQTWFGGDWTAVPGFVSSIGDLAVLILIAPLLMTVWALRKGLFAWPWILLTIGASIWMFYDAIGLTGSSLGLSAAQSQMLAELARGVACAFYFSAGLAQRWIAMGGWKVPGRSETPHPASA